MKGKNLIGHCIKGAHQVMVLDREKIIPLVTKQVGSNVWSSVNLRNFHHCTEQGKLISLVRV